MPDDTLMTVAEEMGLKKVNPAKREELIYRILDQQAINFSANVPEESPRRRGRKPKNQNQAQRQDADNGSKQSDRSEQQDVAAPAATDASAEGEHPQPKRRGRKPKNQEQQPSTDNTNDQTANA